ncbi:TPA: helix-turn-helix domain-containing protein [Streptococcus suis]
MALRNLTSRELANKLDVTEGTISNWRRGLKRPSGRYVDGLEEVLDVRYSDIKWEV